MLKKFITSIFLCFLLFCPMGLTACKNNENNGPEKPISSISILGTLKTEFYVGEKVDIEKLKLVVTYEDASTAQIALTNDMIEDFDTSTVGNKTFVVTYGGKTYTHNYSVRAIRATSIKIDTPFQTHYYTNSPINVKNGKLVVTYEDSSTETISVVSNMISNFNTTTIGSKTMTLTYKECTLNIDYTVADAPILGIALNTTFKTNYFVGESLSVTGGSLTATYADGNNENVIITPDMISNFDNTTVGSRMMIITYKAQTIEVPYQIKVVSLVSIELHTPFKTQYLEGENLDLSGGKLLLRYNDDSTGLIDVLPTMVKGFNNTYVNGSPKTLTITYNDITISVNYTITNLQVTSLTLNSELKNEYFVNDTIVIGETYLTATFNNGSTEENILLIADMISDFNTKSAGQKTMTITYKGFSITYEYFVYSVDVTSIALTTPPTKTQYTYLSKDTLDLTGAVITIYYSNGTSETVTPTSDRFIILGFNTSIIGEFTITFKLKRSTFETTFTYTVVDTSANV